MQVMNKPVTSRGLGRGYRVLIVFSWYSHGILMVFSWCFLGIPRGTPPRCHDGSTERLPDSDLPGRTVIQTKAGSNRAAENAEDSADSTRIESGGMIAWEQVGIQSGLSSL